MKVAQFVDPLAFAAPALRSDLTTHGISGLVVATVPATRPAEFYQIEHVGGAQRDLAVTTARLAFTAWATTTADAAAMAEAIRPLVMAWPWTKPEIQRVAEASGPVPLPDPDDGTPRQTFTVEVALRLDATVDI